MSKRRGAYDRDWLKIPRFNDPYEALPLDVRVAVAHDDYEFADLMLRSAVTPQLLQLKHLARDVLRKADWQ